MTMLPLSLHSSRSQELPYLKVSSVLQYSPLERDQRASRTMASPTAAMRRTTAALWRRRPVATAVGTITGVGLTFASWTEYQARRLSSRSAHQQDPSNSAVAVSMKDRNIVELPRYYDWDAVHTYWAHRPVTAASRTAPLTIILRLGYSHLSCATTS